MLNSAVRLLDIAAFRFPKQIAVEQGDLCITYMEYRERALTMATVLIEGNGINRDPVLIYLPKSIDALVSFMGCMYSGKPYVPVDAEMPISRLAKIIESLNPSHIITNPELAKQLPEVASSITVLSCNETPEIEVLEDILETVVGGVIDTDPVYIMYTSGSTGDPKGVTVPHRGVLDYADWVVNTFEFDENTVMANQAALYFDNSIFDIYGCLLCGGKLILIPDALIMFPSKLPAFLEEKKVTSIFWVPTVMINVANSGALSEQPMPSLTRVSFCGEVMPNRQLNIWRKYHPNCIYANLYGPTEISDVCAYYIVDREFRDYEPLPIGRVCENMRLLILTDEDKAAEVGKQGELCVVGSGLALGYWNAPELSYKAFVQNPLNSHYSERLYRTGDLAYINDREQIIFLGRKDSQIKYKGNRIELGEIENAAACIDGVDSACALFDEERQEIVLFIETHKKFKLRQFNMQLKEFVPKYMVVQRLITMVKFPHTPNGKINRIDLRNRLILNTD